MYATIYSPCAVAALSVYVLPVPLLLLPPLLHLLSLDGVRCHFQPAATSIEGVYLLCHRRRQLCHVHRRCGIRLVRYGTLGVHLKRLLLPQVITQSIGAQ